jgi:thiol-disulfide isomerase/thioredoxin
MTPNLTIPLKRTACSAAVIFCLGYVCFGAALAAPQPAQKTKPATSKTGAANSPSKQNGELPLIDLAGYQKLVAKYKGKPLVVNFWATWCEPCRAEYPMLVGLAKKYEPQGVVFLGVSYDADADLNVVGHFLAMYRPDFPNYRQKPGIDVDGFNHGVDPAWNGAIPSTIFYKPNGEFDAQFFGTRPRAEFEKEIQGLTANPFAPKSGTPGK